MKVSRILLAGLIVLSSWMALASIEVKSDRDAYVTSLMPGRYFPLDFDEPHPVRKICLPPPWPTPKCYLWRSYIHFPADEIPKCVGRATLLLEFTEAFPPWGVRVQVREVDWDGSYITWDTQPPLGPARGTQVVGPQLPRVYKFDVTETVQRFLRGAISNVSFAVKLASEGGGWWIRPVWAYFVKPILVLDPCIEVEVKGLSDFDVTQEFLAGHRYAPLGELHVTVKASVPYEVRVCYEVSPTPFPPFSADPVDMAYTWVWFTVPSCPGYTRLPGFSGIPGTESCTYRVRVDLADLGDRAAGESFSITIKVWAVPR